MIDEKTAKWVRCHGPFEKGFVYSGHRHWVDHMSYVHEGTSISVKFRHQNNGPVVTQKTFDGPCRFFVAAGVFHEIEVLSDLGVWNCEFDVPESDSPVAAVFNHELLD